METRKLNQLILENRKMIWFLVSFFIASLITNLLHEHSFTQAQTYVLFLLIFSVSLWLTEAVPPFAVGIFIIAYLVFTLGYNKFIDKPLDVTIYRDSFSNSVIWLMMGGFFLASAMTKTRLDVDLIRLTMKISGKHPKRVLFAMMLVTMIFSMLISNTATTAMVIAALMPLLVKLGKGSPVSKALVLGIPIAATTGGMGTLIGSPPNAIASGVALLNNIHIDFLTWLYFGVPMALLLTFAGWWTLVKLYIKNDLEISLDEVVYAGEKPAGEFRMKRLVVMIVLAITLFLWLTSPVHFLPAAAVSAIPLVIFPMTGILKSEDVRAIGWDTLLLVAGGLALGTGLQQTGLLDLYAGRVASLQVPGVLFYFLIAYTTMIFSNIMSNTATSTVLIPLGIAIMPGHITEVCMIIGLSASTALFLPVSTPPNAIAFSTGYIKQKDFRVGGTLIGMLGPALIVLWVLFIASLLKTA